MRLAGSRRGAEGAPRGCAPWQETAVSLLGDLARSYAEPGTTPWMLAAQDVRGWAEQALGPIDACVRMGSRSEAGTVRAVALVADARSVVAVECSPSRAEDEDPSPDLRGEALALVLPTAALPAVWLRWAGPLHADEGPGAVVRDVAAIDLRVGDSGEPMPAEASELEPMWAGRWREWSLRHANAEPWPRYVSVPGHGLYAERPLRDGAGVEFAPRPAALVWGDIVRTYCALAPVRAAAGNETHW